MDKPDTITVNVTHYGVIKANRVDIFVSIRDLLLVTGNAALKKAKEVNLLVKALTELGLTEEDIELHSVHAESAKGLLGGSTSAVYQVLVKCRDLNALADILAVIAAQRNGKLDFLSWNYPDDRTLRNEWLKGCLLEAKEKAVTIAAGLGVQVLGVHALSEKWLESQPGNGHTNGSRDVVVNGAKIESVDAQVPLFHSKRLEIQLETQFRVSPFAPN
jgi:hypothetical protein